MLDKKCDIQKELYYVNLKRDKRIKDQLDEK